MGRNIFTQDLSVYSKQYYKILNVIELVTIIVLSFYYSKTGEYPNFNSQFYIWLPALFFMAYLWVSFNLVIRGQTTDELNNNLREAYEYMKTDNFKIIFKGMIYVFYPVLMPLFTGILYGKNGLIGGLMFAIFSFRLTIPVSLIISFLSDVNTTKKQIIFYFSMCLLVFLFSPTAYSLEKYVIVGYLPYLFCLLMPYYNLWRVLFEKSRSFTSK